MRGGTREVSFFPSRKPIPSTALLLCYTKCYTSRPIFCLGNFNPESKVRTPNWSYLVRLRIMTVRENFWSQPTRRIMRPTDWFEHPRNSKPSDWLQLSRSHLCNFGIAIWARRHSVRMASNQSSHLALKKVYLDPKISPQIT